MKYNLKNLLLYRPQTLEQLKQVIREQIVAISQDMLETVMQHFREALRKWFIHDGRHLPD